MVHPYMLREHRQAQKPERRYQGSTFGELARFLQSVEANTQEEKRFKAQHLVVTALKRGHLTEDETALAERLLYEDFRDRRLSTGVERRIRQESDLYSRVLKS